MPIPPKEYPDNAPRRPLRGLPVNVTTTSVQRELLSPQSLFNCAVDNLMETLGVDPAVGGESIFPDSEKITVTADGVLYFTGGRLELAYTEYLDEEGIAACETVVSFDVDDPLTVTVSRTGEVKSALVIEKGKRHICAYETPYMPFEVCVVAKNVVNELTLAGGRMLLDYAVEIKGAAATMSRVEITVRP